MAPTILKTTDLTFSYRQSTRPALSAISLAVGRGEIVGIVGPNGAGKTTLCLTLDGLVPHAVKGRMQGTVEVEGVDTRTVPVHDIARRVGIVLQNPEAQFFGESVEEEIAFGPENLALAPAEIERRIVRSLARVDMSPFRDRFPFHLSGGQKQRVAIAIALAMDPPILVMDEPTSELDPQGKIEVLHTIRQLNREHGCTIVLASHETDELMQVAGRIVLLSASGEVRADGPPAEVLSGPEASALGVRQPQLLTLWDRLGGELGPPPLDTVGAAARLRPGFRLRPHPVSRRTAEGPVVLQCRNLVHEYLPGVRALDRVDLEIRRGEFIAIMGQNGSGKTTLTKHFNCLLRPTSGSVTIRGQDASKLDTATLAQTIGYAFQNPDHQIFCSTVGDEFTFGLRNLGVPQGEIEQRARAALQDARLDVSLDDYPHFLGKGERQKLALATILAMRPDILIVDEPTTGQDWRSALDTMETLKSLNAAGKTVIIVTHDTRVAAEYAQRVVVMARGRIVADGDPADIFYDTTVMEAAALRPPPIVELSTLMTAAGEAPSRILSVEAFEQCLVAIETVRP